MLRYAAILLLLAVSVTVVASRLHGTRAAFTDSETIDIAISSGSVGIEHAGDGLVFDSAPLVPGQTETATVTVKNTGTLPAQLAFGREELASSAPQGCDIRDALELNVLEIDAEGNRTPLASSVLADADAAYELYGFAPGEERTYEVSLFFRAQHGATATDNDNCFQGSVATERFSWQAAEKQS